MGAKSLYTLPRCYLVFGTRWFPLRLRKMTHMHSNQRLFNSFSRSLAGSRTVLVGTLTLGLAVLGATVGGCKIGSKDIEAWQQTVKGPEKMVVVMLSDHYGMDLRGQAAMALVEMERSDVDGIDELKEAVHRLDEETRGKVLAKLAPALGKMMENAEAAVQVRAKDAAYVLISETEGETRSELVKSVVGWYVADFNGRSLAGKASAEQVVRALGAEAAPMLVDAMNAEMPQVALVKLCQLIHEVADEKTRADAGKRIVAIERQMESAEFIEWLKKKIGEQLAEQDPEAAKDEKKLLALALRNRESFVNEGAITAMKHLSSVQIVADRLVEIGTSADVTPIMLKRREMALLALEGNAKKPHLEKLLALALDDASPGNLRDLAFDRVGDIKSPEAIGPMWKLVQNGDDDQQRLRWRAGEMVLAIGGAEIVGQFFKKLPSRAAYEPEELEGYATRLSQMTPPPGSTMTAKLRSRNWWEKVIALKYLERRGTAEDIASVERMKSDRSSVQGSNWARKKMATVGDVATAALEALKERLESEKKSKKDT